MKAILIATIVLVGGAGVVGTAYAFKGDFQCFMCKGTGRSSQGFRCSSCNGTGCTHQEEIQGQAHGVEYAH